MEKNKKKALIVLTRIPYPETDGTRKRIMEDVIKGVVTDFSLDLLVIGDEKLNSESKIVLDNFFSNIFIFSKSKIYLYLQAVKSFFSGRPLQSEYYFDKKISKLINQKIDNYDVVYLHTIRLGKYLEAFGKEDLKKVFLDLNDAISLNYQDAKKLASFPWNLIYAFEEKRVRSYELKLLSLVNHANVVSDFDEQYLKNNCLESKISIPKFYGIFPGVKLNKQIVINQEIKNKIIFFGNIKYPPNKDAVLYFVDYIFPLLRQQNKSINLVIAGNGSESLKLKNTEGIIQLGFVNDLQDLFTDASLVVAPIRFGAGVPTKILEALSYGIPVLTSIIGARGLGNLNNFGIKCLNVEDHLAWILFINKITQDVLLQSKMSTEAQSFIKEKYHQEVIREKYKDAFNSVINSY